VLLVQRKVAPRRGEWCLPGGFMELEETPEAAVLRELLEETGLTGQVTGLIGLKAAPNRIYHTVLVAGYRVAPLEYHDPRRRRCHDRPLVSLPGNAAHRIWQSPGLYPVRPGQSFRIVSS
jgi:ADP-ribose pyrophosphatase YjhB (NUDIX family)